MNKVKLCILQFRDLSYKDIRFARMLKPFEDYGLVERVPKSAAFELGLLFNVLENNELPSFLGQDKLNITPSEAFLHLHNRTDKIPLLVSCYKTEDGRYSQFNALLVHQDLQSLIILAKSRGWMPKNAKTPMPRK